MSTNLKKVGVGFYDALMEHQLYRDNYKAIGSAYEFLTKVSNLNDLANDGVGEFSAVTIMNLFKPHTKGEYKPYVQALIELGLLLITKEHLNPATSDNGKGHCKHYLVTDKGNDLLYDSHLEWLQKLHNDRQEHRRTQKSISARKVMEKTYGDYLLNHIYDGLKHMEYDLKETNKMVDESGWSKATKTATVCYLEAFKEKKFSDLQYNDKTGRVYHEFIQMKSDVRTRFVYKNLPYRAVVDIRACHPTFLSTYVMDYYLTHEEPREMVERGDLETEHRKWIEFFCHPSIHPRDVIAQECGYSTPQTKQAMIETLNGSKQWTVYRKWLTNRFPNIIGVWTYTDLAETSNNISKEYESPLMLNEPLYRLTESMQIKCIPEHDGMGVFARKDDTALPTKLDKVVSFIKDYSMRKWALPLQIKVEFTDL